MPYKILIAILPRFFVYGSGYIYLYTLNTLLAKDDFTKLVALQAFGELSLILMSLSASNGLSRYAALNKIDAAPSVFNLFKYGVPLSAIIFYVVSVIKFDNNIYLEAIVIYFSIFIQAISISYAGFMKGVGDYNCANYEPIFRTALTAVLCVVVFYVEKQLNLINVCVIIFISNIVYMMYVAKKIIVYNIDTGKNLKLSEQAALTVQSLLSYSAKKSDVLLVAMFGICGDIGRFKIIITFCEIPYQFYQNYMSSQIHQMRDIIFEKSFAKKLFVPLMVIYSALSMVMLMCFFALDGFGALPRINELPIVSALLIYFFSKSIISIIENLTMYGDNVTSSVRLSVFEAAVKLGGLFLLPYFGLNVGGVYLALAILEVIVLYVAFIKYVNLYKL